MQEMVEKNAELLRLEDELRADGKLANVPVTPDGDITLDGKAPLNRTVTEALRTGPMPQRRDADRARRSKDTPPLFARAKQDNAGTVADKAQPIGDAAIDAVIKRVQTAFAAASGAALPVRIQNVRDMGDLPPALQEAGRRQQVGKLGKGVFYDGVVYVVQDAHSMPEEVETTIYHELYGHAATSALFGNEWTTRLNALLKAVGGAGGIIRLAEANGIKLQPTWTVLRPTRT